MVQAVDIPPTSQFPQKLYESLPYAIVDVDGRLINSFQKPPLGAVKAYWTNDVKFIQEQYEDAKAMNADEEWLKGLDVQCETNRVDLARLEKGEPCKQAARPANQQRANGTKAQKKQQITMPILTQQLGNGFVGSQQGIFLNSRSWTALILFSTSCRSHSSSTLRSCREESKRGCGNCCEAPFRH